MSRHSTSPRATASAVGARATGLAGFALALVVLAATATGAQAPAKPASADDTLKWRAEEETRLRAEDGWLSVAGLVFLNPGPNAVGSAPDSRVRLPADVSPARLGTITLKDGRVWFAITAQTEATLNGSAATDGELRPSSVDPVRPADVLRVGRVSLLAHLSGPRIAIRLRDPGHPIRTTFTGRRWYPVDQAWRIQAEFGAYPAPRRVTILNVAGDEVEVTSPGVARFRVGDQALSLVAFEDKGRLWFVFTDTTAGQATYRAARFLYAEAPREGRVVLDFNRAENPPCAFNPFTTCPLPPRENRLAIDVPAGERDYPNRWQPR